MAQEQFAGNLVAIALDASSLINLSNANALEIVLGIPNSEFLISPIVAGECHSECVAEFVRLGATCNIKFVQDNEIDADAYLDLLALHALGQGETECLIVCVSGGHSICCDDKKARAVATEMLGEDRVLGSLRLLRFAVQHGRATHAEAFQMYQAMVVAGGFLPELPLEWFQP